MSAQVRFVRVRLATDVDMPAESLGRYPRMESIVETFPKMGRQGYLLHVEELMPGVPILVITHPKSGLREEVPWHLVRQWTRATDDVLLRTMEDKERSQDNMRHFETAKPKQAAGK